LAGKWAPLKKWVSLDCDNNDKVINNVGVLKTIGGTGCPIPRPINFFICEEELLPLQTIIIF
jgi:hypothetical protein